MKRSRGRGRRQGNSTNRNYESNGPDLRVRGNARSIYEKYQLLAHDALSAGELINAENYLQHAEHYFRIMQASQPARPDEDVSETPQQYGSEDAADPMVLNAAEEEAEPPQTAKTNDAENGEARDEKYSRRRGPLRRRRREDADIAAKEAPVAGGAVSEDAVVNGHDNMGNLAETNVQDGMPDQTKGESLSTTSPASDMDDDSDDEAVPV